MGDPGAALAAKVMVRFAYAAAQEPDRPGSDAVRVRFDSVMLAFLRAPKTVCCSARKGRRLPKQLGGNALAPLPLRLALRFACNAPQVIPRGLQRPGLFVASPLRDFINDVLLVIQCLSISEVKIEKSRSFARFPRTCAKDFVHDNGSDSQSHSWTRPE